jgi:hypothetical protein
MAYLRDREIDNIDSHHIFLVVDKACWRDSDLTCLAEHDDILDPLDVYIVIIDGLSDKTDAVYKVIGYEAMPDGD